MIFKNKNILGLSLLEGLVSTAIIVIGFVAEGALAPVNAPIVSQAYLSEAKPLEMFPPLLVSEPSLVT